MKKIKSFLLENKSTRQIFLKNSFWLFLGNVISKILRGILIVIAARVLKTEGYGIYSYALSLAGFFTIFSDVGVSYLLTRELSKRDLSKDEDKKAAAPYIATSFYLKLFLILLCIFLTVSLGPFITRIKEAAVLLPIIAFLTAFDSLRGFFYSFPRSSNKMEIEAQSVIITEIFIGIITTTILFLKPAVNLVTLGYTVGAGIGCLIIGLQTRKIWWEAVKNSSLQFKIAKEIIKTSWPFAIMGILGSFMINIDSVIIGIFRSAHELGIYAAAQKPVQILYIIPSLLGGSMFPIISSLIYKKQNDKVKEIVNRVWRGTMLLAFPITIGGILMAKWIIITAFGSSYASSTLTFQLLLLTLAPVFSGNIWGNVIFAYNQQKIFIKATLWGAISNTLLDFLLIPNYGLPGSAVATIISQLLTNGYFFIHLQKITKIEVNKVKKILLATFFMAVFIMLFSLLNVNNFIIFGGAIITYFVSLIILKEESLRIIPFINSFL